MSGIGRGRGWLSINRNKKARPNAVPDANRAFYEYKTHTTNIEFQEKYQNVVKKIDFYAENDDGIQYYNQNIKTIMEEFSSVCESAAEVE